MLNARLKAKRSLAWSQAKAPLGRPGARFENNQSEVAIANDRSYASALTDSHVSVDRPFAFSSTATKGLHPLTSKEMNSQLSSYERSVKADFDDIELTLNEVSKLQIEADYEIKAKAHIRKKLGIEIPESVNSESWCDKPDMFMRKLYAW